MRGERQKQVPASVSWSQICFLWALPEGEQSCRAGRAGAPGAKPRLWVMGTDSNLSPCSFPSMETPWAGKALQDWLLHQKDLCQQPWAQHVQHLQGRRLQNQQLCCLLCLPGVAVMILFAWVTPHSAQKVHGFNESELAQGCAASHVYALGLKSSPCPQSHHLWASTRAGSRHGVKSCHPRGM